MGLISWLFGSSGVVPTPVATRLEPGRFGKDRHAPPGQWVQTTMMLKVAGVMHRRDAATAFANSIRISERSGAAYGVEVEPEPENPHDRNAVAVYGVARGSRWHVGYLDAHTAEEINRDLISKGIPIAAELYEIWVGDDGFIDIKIIVLAPPGNSLKARLKRNNP